MKIIGIILARMESKRFPGKMMAEINGRSILQHCIETSKRLNVDDIIVATGYPQKNKEIIDLCKRLKIKAFAGVERNVLKRVLMAAIQYRADYVLRINADCPFMNPPCPIC